MDTPLNETGRDQAAEIAERIASWSSSDAVNGSSPGAAGGIRSLWASDLVRALETAQIVAARIGLDPVLDPRLREGNRGRWEGRRFVDIAREEPDLYAAWRRAGAEFRFPGGESLLEQQERVTAALTDIHSAGPLPALVVCHGGSIRVMLCAADPRGLDAFHDFDVPNVAVVPL
jgi:broad specificity phosphatase PhoE